MCKKWIFRFVSEPPYITTQCNIIVKRPNTACNVNVNRSFPETRFYNSYRKIIIVCRYRERPIFIQDFNPRPTKVFLLHILLRRGHYDSPLVIRY